MLGFPILRTGFKQLARIESIERQRRQLIFRIAFIAHPNYRPIIPAAQASTIAPRMMR